MQSVSTRPDTAPETRQLRAPRVRFTIRSLMIAVAAAAGLLALPHGLGMVPVALFVVFLGPIALSGSCFVGTGVSLVSASACSQLLSTSCTPPRALPRMPTFYLPSSSDGWSLPLPPSAASGRHGPGWPPGQVRCRVALHRRCGWRSSPWACCRLRRSGPCGRSAWPLSPPGRPGAGGRSGRRPAGSWISTMGRFIPDRCFGRRHRNGQRWPDDRSEPEWADGACPSKSRASRNRGGPFGCDDLDVDLGWGWEYRQED